MDKFASQREEAQKKFEAMMAKIAEDEKKEVDRLTAPLVSKFSALLGEEVEKFIRANPDHATLYKFQKAELRARLKAFVTREFGS